MEAEFYLTPPEKKIGTG